VNGVPEHVPRGLFCYKVNAAQSLIGGAVSNAGNVSAWLQQTLKMSGDPFDNVDDITLPNAHGLRVEPSWAGARSPNWDDNARAVISGMTLNTTADDIARAALEAVLYQIAAVDDLLCATIGRQLAIYAAGGVLSSSPGWAQVTADILGRDVHLCADSQASARGTALLALNTYAEPTISAIYSARPLFTEIYSTARTHYN
jgi:gluconokinase